MKKQSKTKISRSLGMAIVPKAEKYFSRRPYPPGPTGQRSRRYSSEYGKELKEKQKLRHLYNLKEKHFKKYVKKALDKRTRERLSQDILIESLEQRLDNAVYRLGFAETRSQARQFVSHYHFLVNGKKVNISSFQVSKDDVVALSPKSRESKLFKDIGAKLKKQNVPAWLKLDLKKLEATVVGKPTFEEAAPPVEISTVFEYYSR